MIAGGAREGVHISTKTIQTRFMLHNAWRRTEHSGSVSRSCCETVDSEALLVAGSAATKETKRAAPIASEPASLITPRGEEYIGWLAMFQASLPLSARQGRTVYRQLFGYLAALAVE